MFLFLWGTEEQALYAAHVIDIDAKRLDTLLNKFARRQFGLPTDTSTVFLRTELDIRRPS